MKWFNYLLIAIFLPLASFAQTIANVGEGPYNNHKGEYNAFYVDLIHDSDAKEVEKEWKSFIKSYKGKTKKVKKSDDFMTDDATIPDMSENTVDIISRADKNGNQVRFIVWYNLGGAYLSTAMHPDRAVVAEKMLQDFALTREKAAVERKLQDEEKKLKGLSGDLKDMVKDKEGLESDIKKYEEKIEEARTKISENLKAQEAKQGEINAQKGVIEGVKTELKKF